MIHIGVAGWDYSDWAGIVYPSPLPKRFDRLAFLAEFFDAVEINVSFYRPIAAETSCSWVDRTLSGRSFRFTAKLYRAFTHARGSNLVDDSDSLDLRAEARVFRAGIEPLVKSGRLAAVLMQFPHAFHDHPESRAHLARLAELLAGLPLVAEFRHRSWDDDGALSFLRELGVGFCNIDQPALGSTLPPTEHLTSRVGYVRLHGRNAANWFSRRNSTRELSHGRETGSARYDYLYSMAELAPWVERSKRLAVRAEEVIIIANNHYRGQGPANALMMKSALEARRVPAPAGLVAAYPELQDLAEPVEGAAGKSPRQGRLFGDRDRGKG